MKILTAGGGIGGMTAAIALSRAGHEVTLAEQTPAFEAVGAGIALAPNAVKVLAELGVDPEPYAFALPALEIVDDTGRRLQRIDTGRLADRHGPTWALPRPGLHAALTAALPPGVRVLHGHRVTAVQDTGESVEVRFRTDADADTGTGTGTGTDADGVHRFDVVIGADGLNSTVRTAAVGDVRRRYSGDTCWRGITGNPGFGHAVESWGVGSRIGVVPLRGDRLYYFLVRTAPRRAPAPKWPDGFRRVFAGHSEEMTRLFDVLTEPPPLHHDLEELDRPTWGRGRILLLGDAAHAMTPNQGQGAAMAIEDAFALATVLDDDITASMRRYVGLRGRRVRGVQLVSRRIGQTAHWRNPAARRVRDLAMRAAPRPVADAQYRRIVRPALDLLASGGTAHDRPAEGLS